VCVSIKETNANIPLKNIKNVFYALLTKAKGVGLGLTVIKLPTKVNKDPLSVRITMGEEIIFPSCVPRIVKNKKL